MNPEKTPREILCKKVYGAMLKTFNQKKTRAFMWVKAHFGSSVLESYDMGDLEQILLCVTSKRKQEICPIHDRLHDLIKPKK